MTPVEIVQRAVMVESGCGLQFGEERAFCDDPRAEEPMECVCKLGGKAAIAALESAGWRLTHPDVLSTKMDNTASEYFTRSFADWKQCWRHVLAAAPLYGKG